MRHCRSAALAALFLAPHAFAEPPRDYTSFQDAAPYSPETDVAADVAMVYGLHDFAQRAKEWRENGYHVSMMTGISWGQYADYYGKDEAFKKDEVQTMANGELRMHGKNVGYNVPTPAYIEYIKRLVEPAVDAGALGIFLEEPEFWANTGWSAGFQAEWERRYGEPWQAPDSSVDAQYRASRLKYELYTHALQEVFRHVKARAAEQGKTVECHVPTHTLINYAHWHIVSPMSALMDVPEVDGYIAQVWTGTARTPNRFRDRMRERTFETAYFEYAQALAMVRPTGRKVWFLADPIEDNPNHTWEDYKLNYEATITASLLFPEVHRFEVMPWPRRIFTGSYPKADEKDAEREGIPEDYAAEILTVINALNDMDQPDTRLEAGEEGIGILVSDSMMFQRAAPQESDPALGFFYGLAMPLLKHGMPAQVVQMETVKSAEDLKPFRALLLSYEGQKPLHPEYHDILRAWVEGGGKLLYAGDNADPYHHVREWWNDDATNDRTARDALLETLGVAADTERPQDVGAGQVVVLDRNPSALTRDDHGDKKLLSAVASLLGVKRSALNTSPHVLLERGPYRVAASFDETDTPQPLKLAGDYVSLFDPALAVQQDPVVLPGARDVLVSLKALRERGTPHVAAASTRIKIQEQTHSGFRLLTRGPKGTPARVRLWLPEAPAPATIDGTPAQSQIWDAESGTLYLEFPNQARDVEVLIPGR
ncbi:MAG: hypothetical protein GC168_12095 [Candidatus Hydrogenedens sp.]|nr:hypothetical protein [Candidatus Hydrogenedens sp.]